jgi:hypothetical protein
MKINLLVFTRLKTDFMKNTQVIQMLKKMKTFLNMKMYAIPVFIMGSMLTSRVWPIKLENLKNDIKVRDGITQPL